MRFSSFFSLHSFPTFSLACLLSRFLVSFFSHTHTHTYSFRLLLGFMDDNSKCDKNALNSISQHILFIIHSLLLLVCLFKCNGIPTKNSKEIVHNIQKKNSYHLDSSIRIFFLYSFYVVLHSIWTANSQINGIKHKQRYDNNSIKSTFLSPGSSSLKRFYRKIALFDAKVETTKCALLYSMHVTGEQEKP